MHTVELWMDVVCPWSRLTLIELYRTITENRISAIVWLRSFRIDPSAESADYGKTTIEHLTQKLNISVNAAHNMLDGVVQAGSERNVAFNFDNARGGNTFDSHRLIQAANNYSLSIPVALGISKAHFEDGKLPAEDGLLLEIAKQVGLPDDVIAEFENTNSFGDAVLADEMLAKQLNIESRPTMFINGELAFVGLPQQDELLALLKQSH